MKSRGRVKYPSDLGHYHKFMIVHIPIETFEIKLIPYSSIDQVDS